MALSKEERDRLTLKALQLQQKTRQRKSVLEPYKEWIREMIEQRDMTFKILTNVLQDECQIKITEQSLNEWYRRHIGRPPRSRSTSTRGGNEKPSEDEGLMELPAAPEKPAAPAPTRGHPTKGAPAKLAPPKKRLEYNSPDEWSL